MSIHALVLRLEPPAAASAFGQRAPRAVSDVVQRAQAGEHAAFEQLYRENVGRVYALCLRLVADSRGAEELTQDVFVRAWEKLTSFRGDSAFSSWLHRLAVNVVLADRRAAGRRESRVTPTDQIERLSGPTREPPPGLSMDLDQAIAALPPGARTVLVLHDIEGYGHEEIAQMTGKAAGTSKAQLHRARRLLREALDR